MKFVRRPRKSSAVFFFLLVVSNLLLASDEPCRFMLETEATAQASLVADLHSDDPVKSERAYATLFANDSSHKLYRALWKTVGEQETDDAMQSVALKLLQKKQEFADLRHFTYWAVKVAKRETIDAHRKAERRRNHQPASFGAYSSLAAISSPGLEAQLEHLLTIEVGRKPRSAAWLLEKAEQRETRLKRAMEKLSSRMAQLSTSVLIEKHPIAEVAAQLGLDVREAELLLAKSRLILRPFLGGLEWQLRNCDYFPANRRQIAEGFWVEDLSYKQLAQRTGYTKNNLGYLQSDLLTKLAWMSEAAPDIQTVITEIVPETDRELAEYRWIAGYSKPELAHLLGLSEAEISSRLDPYEEKLKAGFAEAIRACRPPSK